MSNLIIINNVFVWKLVEIVILVEFIDYFS